MSKIFYGNVIFILARNETWHIDSTNDFLFACISRKSYSSPNQKFKNQRCLHPLHSLDACLNLVAGLQNWLLLDKFIDLHRRDKVLLASRDSKTRLLKSRKPRLAVDPRLTRSLIHSWNWLKAVHIEIQEDSGFDVWTSESKEIVRRGLLWVFQFFNKKCIFLGI